jgi:two-component system response regulator PilR (NtrC family)
VDVRLITASKRDLMESVDKGTFRDDLFYRINVVCIEVPPLRERKEDIPLLAHHFLSKYSFELGKEIKKISPEAMRVLLRYEFPGNVRELENIIERAVILESKDQITPSSLPDILKAVEGNGVDMGDIPSGFLLESSSLDEIVGEIEKNFLLKALERTGGNKTEAAKLLKISFRSLRYRLEKYGIE